MNSLIRTGPILQACPAAGSATLLSNPGFPGKRLGVKNRNALSKSILSLFLLTIGCFTAVDAAEEKNFILNSDFAKLNSRGLPEDWKYSVGKNARIANESGKNAFTLNAESKHDRFKISLSQYIAELPPGNYLFAGALSGDFDSLALVFSRTANPGQPRIAPVMRMIKKSAMAPEGNGWLNFSVRVNIPEGNKGAIVVLEAFCQKEGDGVSFADIKLLPAGEARAASAAPIIIKKNFPEITGRLVARPAAAADQKWELHQFAGRDLWQLLYDAWHTLPGVKEEEFVKNAGSTYVRLPLVKENFSPTRYMQIKEINIFTAGDKKNIAPESGFSVKNKEDGVFFDGIANLNDGKLNTFCEITGSTEAVKKRFTPVKADITVTFPSPRRLEKITIHHDDTAAVGTMRFSDENGNEIKPAATRFEATAATAEFKNAPACKVLTIQCASPQPVIRIGSISPKMEERLKKFPFYPGLPFHMGAGALFGMTPENIDKKSFQAFYDKYKDTLMGVYIPEWDSNYFHLWKRKDSPIYKDFMQYVEPEKNRIDAERNMRNIWNYQYELFLGNLFGLCGQLNFPHYSLEWGGNLSAMELAGNSLLFPHRTNLLFTHGASRQYNKPWLMYLAYFAGYSNANSKAVKPKEAKAASKVDGLDYGIAPSLGRRLYYICYYQGVTFFDYESQPWGQVVQNEDGSCKLTANGEAIKDIYEWSRNPKGKRGSFYAPVLLLMDYYHGHGEWSRGKDWKVWYFKNFEDGDYMAEHFLRTIDPVNPVGGRAFDTPPYSYNLNNGRLGDIYSLYLANPPSGAATLDELGKYPVTILLDKIDINAELAGNLKKYVAAGGTLLINAAQADVFRNDVEFLGLKPTGEYAEADGFQAMKVELSTANVEIKAENGMPLLTANHYGKGKLLFTTPYFMLLKDKKACSPLIEKILAKIQDEVVPLKVEGDIQFLYNKMPDGVWKLILINNKGIFKMPESSEEKHIPGFTAKVTITVPNSQVTALELSENAELARDGNVFSLEVPPAGIRIIDFKGIEFKEKENAGTLIGSRDFGTDKNQARRKARITSFADPKNKAVGREPAVTEREPNGGSGVMAEWNFDEGSGDVAKDTSGNGRDAKIYNAKYVKTPSGHALNFNGIDSFVNVVIKLKSTLKEGSYEAWVKPDISPGVKWGGSSRFSDDQRRGQVFYATNILVHMFQGGKWGSMTYDGNISGAVGPNVKNREWAHLVYTWKMGIARFYVNGKPAGNRMEYTHPIGNNLRLKQIELTIGAHSPGSYLNFNGLIDDVRLYGYALDAEEVKGRHEKGLKER